MPLFFTPNFWVLLIVDNDMTAKSGLDQTFLLIKTSLIFLLSLSGWAVTFLFSVFYSIFF